MERVAAKHTHWNGHLLLSEQDDVVLHEGRGSHGRYKIDGERLNVLWDQFESDNFTKISGVWVHQRLLDATVRIEDINVINAVGKCYLADRIRLIVLEARAEVELRLNTSDVPTNCSRRELRIASHAFE